MTHAFVDIWRLDGEIANCKDVEKTVEAEVTFLIRKLFGQWPKYQTEIHFHQSDDEHRNAAKMIVDKYRSASCPTG